MTRVEKNRPAGFKVVAACSKPSRLVKRSALLSDYKQTLQMAPVHHNDVACSLTLFCPDPQPEEH
jgi:hypothetical protein